MGTVSVTRYHDFCAGHTVTGHEGKCRHLHGHNYRVHFTCEAGDGELDDVGRVLDFSVIKNVLCEWLEDNWDHKFLIWEKDLRKAYLMDIEPTLVVVPFNPTAENMAIYLVESIGPKLLEGTGTVLTHVEIEETRKCSAGYGL